MTRRLLPAAISPSTTGRSVLTVISVVGLLAVGSCATGDDAGGGQTGSGGTRAGSGGSNATGAGGGSGSGSGGVGVTGSGGSNGGGAGNSGNGGTSGGAGGMVTTGGAGGRVGGSGGITGGGTGGTTVGGTGGAVTGAGGAVAVVREFWISPTGSDTNPGTRELPLFTLCNDDLNTGACYKVCRSSTAGCLTGNATIWVMDGTYRYGAVTQKIGSTKLCSAANPCNIFAEAGAKPVFDFTGQPISTANRGVQIQGDYWHLRGITVTKSGDSGIFVMGNNNTVEQCIAHHNQDVGIIVGVNSSRAGSGSNNLFLNCDSYQNFDTANDGENADGFGAKESVGAGNVFRGCRAWDNGDDGWDFYGWGSPITVDNCWAISQTATVNGGASDGNGFKLGGNNVSARHVLSNLFAVSNGANGSSGRGFTNNSNPATLTCTGTCGSYGNKASDTGVGGISRTTGPTAARMIGAVRAANGNLPSIDSL